MISHGTVWKSRQKYDDFLPSNQCCKEVNKELISRNFLSVIPFYMQYFSTLWCGNFKNFPPRLFCKNFVKVIFSLKSYTVYQFDEKNLQWGKIFEITSLCTVFCTPQQRTMWSHWEKYLVKSVNFKIFSQVKKLISRNFRSKAVRPKSHNFHTTMLCIIFIYVCIYKTTIS